MQYSHAYGLKGQESFASDLGPNVSMKFLLDFTKSRCSVLRRVVGSKIAGGSFKISFIVYLCVEFSMLFPRLRFNRSGHGGGQWAHAA